MRRHTDFFEISDDLWGELQCGRYNLRCFVGAVGGAAVNGLNRMSPQNGRRPCGFCAVQLNPVSVFERHILARAASRAVMAIEILSKKIVAH